MPDTSRVKDIPGGLSAVKGIRAAGVHCGIKPGDLDLALIATDRPASVVGVFTSNRVQAAPVLACRRRLRGGWLQAVVVNSGNANACNGRGGLADAEAMAREAARATGADPRAVFVASTGVIGRRLPMAKVRRGIRAAAARLRADGGQDAARAIMTTDTVPKEAAASFEFGGARITVGGIGKGAAMICPRMATMLAFIATDAAVERAALARALRRSVAGSFNRITVDGDTSTNDTVLCFANGAAGAPPLRGRGLALFQEALDRVAGSLARLIVRDAEGATKFVAVTVEGARTAAEAERAARAVAHSPLVKTTLFGQDANWGRIVCALGYAGVALAEAKVAVWIGGVPVVRNGRGLGAARERRANLRMREREIPIRIALGLGRGSATIWTTDLSADYVRMNADYRS
jgi:glutamate N-acetyltransferase/amino-acid N-acetyltransferase